jgi:hypothetical protein
MMKNLLSGTWQRRSLRSSWRAITLLLVTGKLYSSTTPQTLLEEDAVPKIVKSIHQQIHQIAPSPFKRILLQRYFLEGYTSSFDKSTVAQELSHLNKIIATSLVAPPSSVTDAHKGYLQSLHKSGGIKRFGDVLTQPSASDVLNNNSLFTCVDYSKIFIDKFLAQKSNDKISVFFLAEKKSFLQVCRSKLDHFDNDPIGIHPHFTAVPLILSGNDYYIVNPESKNLEVFKLNKKPALFQEFVFPSFTAMGASSFLVTGEMPLVEFLNGFSITEANSINLKYSKQYKECSL